MYPLVLAIEPARKRAPYILYGFDGLHPGAEEVLLDEAYSILDRPFGLGIGLMTDPELQFLLSAEVVEDSRLDDFTVGLAGDEHSVLVYDQSGRSAAKLEERAIYRLASFFSIVLMILCIDDQIATVSEEETDEVYSESS